METDQDTSYSKAWFPVYKCMAEKRKSVLHHHILLWEHWVKGLGNTDVHLLRNIEKDIQPSLLHETLFWLITLSFPTNGSHVH